MLSSYACSGKNFQNKRSFCYVVPFVECCSHLRDIPSLQVDPRKDFLQLDRTLRGLCYCGRLTEAVRLLCNTGVQVDAETYALLVQECIYSKAYENGRIVHAQMVVVGYVPDAYMKTKLLILYTKLGDLNTANILFSKLNTKSSISWNAMIAGYVQKGGLEIGLNLYYEMRSNGLIPDQYTFASVFRACSSLATLEHGKRAHSVMIKSHMKENVVVSSALIDMYFKCSSLADGQRAFDRSLERNVVTWTALISGYGQHGKVTEVLDSFQKMLDEGFKPNYVTFLAVLSACSHGGLVDEGRAYFNLMAKQYGIQPRGQHYATMVDILGRAGRLGEAYELVLNSPCVEHPVIWGSLLGASRTHGNMDLLKIAAKRYLELEPENAGKYVVLANGYATFGLWDKVAEVWEVMKNIGMMKEPAYSRIEVKEKMHTFHKGDRSHETAREICETIKQVTCILKDIGFVPDIDAD
ncbi:pentatricopeptide repeat-containing protein At4g16470 [Eucalyptus grandis]|uniref:pentatricopeptide repeat-containing protein At4g16470 n=1 Tax=Eucalyptus grandis TaxID=71139 RepID=UPI00192E8A93|nr:pentatricopeptide repeat-containing protein At4g16470 [Eucalyptus grandis]